MAQINAPKINAYAKVGPTAASVAKLNMYVRMVPGSGDFAPEYQSAVFAQKIVR